MVLLTYSHVTILLSSTLVTVFTFLLFLSGYVLQQQSLRAIQESLHPPPPPKSTLPVFFSDVENGTDEIGDQKVISAPPVVRGSSKQEVLDFVRKSLPDGIQIKGEGEDASNNSTLSTLTVTDQGDAIGIWSKDGQTEEEKQSQPSKLVAGSESLTDSVSARPRAAPTGSEARLETDLEQISRETTQRTEYNPHILSDHDHYGYVLVTPSPSLVCSAVLFYTQLSYSQSTIPHRLIFYPSYWESVPPLSDSHTTALAFLKLSAAEQNITVQPLDISPDHGSIDPELTMLSTLSTSASWMLSLSPTLTTILYIRSPGLLLNSKLLEEALTSASTNHRSWSPLPSPISSTSFALTTSTSHSAPHPPTHLLLSLSDGPSPSHPHAPRPRNPRLTIRTPSHPSTQHLILPALTSHAQNHASEIELEARVGPGSGVGYVAFSKEELRERRREGRWYGGVYERFERGRRGVCSGIDEELEEIDIDSREEGSRRRGWK